VRAAVVAVVVVVAYQYSLATLLGEVGTETPLAYLGLVPLIALLLIAGLLWLPDRQPAIHDRYLDYIVGIPLLAVAVLIVGLGPLAMSTFFWLWRLDLVSLPLFAAGAIALAFGSRTLWRLRFPVAFLILAWPPPYTLFLNGWLDDFTNATLFALRSIVHVLPLATAASYGDGSLFQITHGSSSFVISVASACSGVNSVLGFLLVGAAALLLVRGPRWLKLAWLVLGMLLIWSLNVLRIVLLFAAAKTWGEALATDVLHPFVGLAFFCLGVLVMIVLMSRFQLTMAVPSVSIDHRAPRPRTPPAHAGPPAVRRGTVALAIVALLGAVVAVSDAQLSRYELLAQNLGPPRVGISTLAATPVRGWSLFAVASYPGAQLYFGGESTWLRYTYRALPGTDTRGLTSLVPLTLDVISTPDLGSFETYSVQDCYHFHDYQVSGLSSASLGGGVVATTAVYQVAPHQAWGVVYWEWPVTTSSGEVYQRIVLTVLTGEDPAMSQNRLIGFARQLLSATGHQAAEATSS
jgi:exosortase/archaeosortase family protein